MLRESESININHLERLRLDLLARKQRLEADKENKTAFWYGLLDSFFAQYYIDLYKKAYEHGIIFDEFTPHLELLDQISLHSNNEQRNFMNDLAIYCEELIQDQQPLDHAKLSKHKISIANRVKSEGSEKLEASMNHIRSDEFIATDIAMRRFLGLN